MTTFHRLYPAVIPSFQHVSLLNAQRNCLSCPIPKLAHAVVCQRHPSDLSVAMIVLIDPPPPEKDHYSSNGRYAQRQKALGTSQRQKALASACPKRLFDKLVDGEASSPPRPASPDFAEIPRIPAAKSAPVAPYTPPATMGIRVAPSPLVLSLRFSTVCASVKRRWLCPVCCP